MGITKEEKQKQAKGETLHRLKSTNPDKGKMNVFLIVWSLYMLWKVYSSA